VAVFFYVRNRTFVMHIPESNAPYPQQVGSSFSALLWLPSLIAQATIVIWLIWQHQATANLWARGYQGLHIRPGWAVGWWFIPVANLAMPLVAMLELDRRSTLDGRPRKASALLGWWWAAWLSSSFIPIIGVFGAGFDALVEIARTTDERATVVDFTPLVHDIAPWFLVAGGLQAIAAALAFTVVQRIDDAQQPMAAAGIDAPMRPDVG
jgi:hypothetical protein